MGTPLGLAGFVSKDVIIETTWAAQSGVGQFAFALLVISAAFTAFYSWRLIFMTFHGETRADRHTYEHAHESPMVMMLPLYALAIGALLAGMEFYPDFVGYGEDAFWAGSIVNVIPEGGESILVAAHHVPVLVKLAPFLAMLGGLGTAWWFYIRAPELPAALAARHQGLYQFLLNKWYFDELYRATIVGPAMWVGRTLWKLGDGAAIDGLIDGLAMGWCHADAVRGAGPVRLPVPLRLRHADRHLRADHLVRGHRGGRVMADTNLLTLVTFFPLIAALALILFLRGEDEAAQENAKRLGLLATSATFLLSLAVLTGFDPSDPGFQFVEEGAWLGGLTYKMGVDGISLPLIMLTTFFFPLVMLASWTVTHRVKEYVAAFLLLETLIIGVFTSLDLILFYLFFEGGLIPMFLIIGIWGGKERIYAAFKFFLYTLLGSLLMLVAMIYMYYDAGTTDIPRC